MNKERMIAQWALDAQGSPYVYGGTGRRCTPAYRKQLMAQYPQHAPAIQAFCPVLSGIQKDCRGCRHEGRSCYDCAQFTRRALEAAGISLPSGASSQWRSDSWAHKGDIKNLPRGRVCVLFRQSGDSAYPMAHTGLYLGDGTAMDARSHAQGVLRRPVEAYPWTHYAIPHGLDGEACIRQGARGEHVRKLQQLLLACGYTLPRHGADGIFGEETLAALNHFQRDNGQPAAPAADDQLLMLLKDMADKRDGTLPDACANCPHRKAVGA